MNSPKSLSQMTTAERRQYLETTLQGVVDTLRGQEAEADHEAECDCPVAQAFRMATLALLTAEVLDAETTN